MSLSGSNLQSYGVGLEDYFYDSGNEIPASAGGHVIILSGGTNFTAGAYVIAFAAANYQGSGHNLITLSPLNGSATSARTTGLATGGTWTSFYGTSSGGGSSGTNLIQLGGFAGFFYDPDSPIGLNANGGTFAVTGGTNYTDGSYYCPEINPNFGGRLVATISGLATNGYGGTWSITPATPPFITQLAAVPVNTVFRSPIKLGLIGDSITVLNGSNFQSYLASTFPNASSTTFDNMGQSGSTTANWLPASTFLTNAISTANSHGLTVIQIMLGTNDASSSVTPTTYIANMRAIVDALFAGISTLKYVVVQDIPTPQGSSAVALNAALAGIGHGATLGTFGDYALASNNPNFFGDGLHPTGGAGSQFLSLEWMKTIQSVVPAAIAFAASGPSGGTSGSVSSAFTVTLDNSNVFSGADVVTLTASEGTITATAASGSISGNGTGTVIVTPASGATSFTYTYTPGTAGSKTITYTNGQGWTNPSASGYTATSPDTTPPTVTAASINTDGDTLTLTVSESSTGHNGIGLSGGASLTYISATSTTISYSISPTVKQGQTRTLSYIPGDIADDADNAMEAFSGADVTNNSTVVAATLSASSGAGAAVLLLLLKR